jgi:hypothetical protein
MYSSIIITARLVLWKIFSMDTGLCVFVGIVSVVMGLRYYRLYTHADTVTAWFFSRKERSDMQ